MNLHTLDQYVNSRIQDARRDHEAKAAQRRLVRAALEGRKMNGLSLSVYKPLMARLGNQLVLWGTSLQRRYAGHQDYDHQTATLPCITT